MQKGFSATLVESIVSTQENGARLRYTDIAGAHR